MNSLIYAVACVLLLLPDECATRLKTSVVGYDRQQTTRMQSALARRCLASSGRRVTYALPDTGLAGGFGDRILGMVTTYYVALMTRSKFYVNWTRPYNLNDYFDVLDCAAFERNRQPALHDASITFEAAEVRAIDAWSYFENGTFLQDVDRDIRIATNARHWQDVVRAAQASATAGALGVDALSRRDLFTLALRSLLSPKRHVTASARAVLHKLAPPSPHSDHARAPRYVGVQIRCGSEGSLSWSDPARHSLRDVPCFVRETVRACGARARCPIFLTADSAGVASLFKAELARHRQQAAGLSVIDVVAEADGPILHTDRTNTSMLDAGQADPWLRSIVDWWLLQHASHLVISRSGFGETAAWASSSARTTCRLELGVPGTCNVSDFTSASVF